MLILAAIALALWLAVLALPWRPWSCREYLEADAAERSDTDALTVLIPARDEAALIGETLRAIADTAPDAAIVLIDDQSSDGTVEAARRCGLPNLTIVHGTPPPEGWAGKLWALQQGLARTNTPQVLLLDADIRLAPGLLAALQRKADTGYALASVCAEPCWQGWAARWLLPAFVYFFKLLYPFALANRADSRVAAAAGGVILVERAALTAAGGFSAWRDAIIDDCTLAAHVKRAGQRCWIGLSHGARSLRHEDIGDIARMVARSAFVQLRESWWLVVAATALLVLAFWIPVLAVVIGTPAAKTLGALAWLALAGCYLPTLLFYRRNPLAAIALPLAATFFLVMTWYSAARALTGTRSVWKDRRYPRGAH
ncbi:MAG TPA: glycosyltransferase [Rhodanobacteraceae bacterium]|jgi:hopene-associated glycosyltransferase HpnB|nr:glycosyltransferase [Rhodanobacteraceae bacterium]